MIKNRKPHKNNRWTYRSSPLISEASRKSTSSLSTKTSGGRWTTRWRTPTVLTNRDRTARSYTKLKYSTFHLLKSNFPSRSSRNYKPPSTLNSQKSLHSSINTTKSFHQPSSQSPQRRRLQAIMPLVPSWKRLSMSSHKRKNQRYKNTTT